MRAIQNSRNYNSGDKPKEDRYVGLKNAKVPVVRQVMGIDGAIVETQLQIEPGKQIHMRDFGERPDLVIQDLLKDGTIEPFAYPYRKRADSRKQLYENTLNTAKKEINPSPLETAKEVKPNPFNMPLVTPPQEEPVKEESAPPPSTRGRKA